MTHGNRHPLTRQELKAELKNYPTKADLKAALKRSATQETVNRLTAGGPSAGLGIASSDAHE